MFWDIGPDPKSVDPDFNLGMTLGDNYDTDYGVFGFLSAVSYENEWNINQGSQGNNLGTVGCSDLPDRYSKDGKCFAQFLCDVVAGCFLQFPWGAVAGRCLQFPRIRPPANSSG